jgi:hypothetical protein
MCCPPQFFGRERASSPDGLLPKARELAEFGDSHRSPSEDRRKQQKSVAVPELRTQKRIIDGISVEQQPADT